jgi:hypothetical protein
MCIDCGRFSLRAGNAELARAGFGRCVLERNPGRYVAARHPRQCNDAEPTTHGAERRAWLEGHERAPPADEN